MNPDTKTGLKNDPCLLLIVLLFVTVCLSGIYQTVNFGKDFLVPKGTSFSEFVASSVQWRSLFYYIGSKIDELGLEPPTIYLPVDSRAYLRSLKIRGRWKYRLKRLKKNLRNYIVYPTYPRTVKFEFYDWKISDRKQQRILENYGQYCHQMGDYTIVILTDACKGKRACYMYFNRRFIVIGPKNLRALNPKQG
jgi:hypothetical protein